MSPTILPEIVRSNLAPMRHALDAYEECDPTPEQADELFFLCSFLADAIEKSWATIQSGMRKGIEGRKLSLLLQEASDQIDEALRTGERFQNRIFTIPEGQNITSKPSQLSTDLERVRRVRQQVAALLDWVNAPSSPPELERLKALESGPFVPLTDLQSPHGSPTS